MKNRYVLQLFLQNSNSSPKVGIAFQENIAVGKTTVRETKAIWETNTQWNGDRC
jgi:hypothetical protein